MPINITHSIPPPSGNGRTGAWSRYPTDIIVKAMRAREAGKSYREIADIADVCLATARNWTLKYKGKSPAEIEQLNTSRMPHSHEEIYAALQELKNGKSRSQVAEAGSITLETLDNWSKWYTGKTSEEIRQLLDSRPTHDARFIFDTLQLLKEGKTMLDVARSRRMNHSTLSRWNTTYGGLSEEEINQLMESQKQNPEIIYAVVQAVNAGETHRQVARRFNIVQSTLQNWLKRYGGLTLEEIEQANRSHQGHTPEKIFLVMQLLGQGKEPGQIAGRLRIDSSLIPKWRLQYYGKSLEEIRCLRAKKYSAESAQIAQEKPES